MPLIVRAPAKINLDLRILSRRIDGFHDLQTLLQSISLHDTLIFTRCQGCMTVGSQSSGVPKGKKNIVWRAAKVLWKDIGGQGDPKGVSISITKRIPMAAGLGGGSSNAAAALRGLCLLWGVLPSGKRLRELAASVGADVPYFLTGGLSVGFDRGIRLRRLSDLEQYWVVLASPTFGVPTALAYKWFDQLPAKVSTKRPRHWRQQLRLLGNDLQESVVSHHPEIGVMVDRFQATNASLSAMTGSGSTVFGLYRRKVDAVFARRQVRSRGWQTILSWTIGSREFTRLTESESGSR